MLFSRTIFFFSHIFPTPPACPFQLLLAAGAATSGGVNSSLASGFVRFGSREGSPEVSMGQIGLEAEAESELLLEERARNLSEVTIAKSKSGGWCRVGFLF